MPLERLLHKSQGCGFIAGSRHIAFEKLAFMVDGPPKIDHLTLQLPVHLIKMSFPMSEAPHPANSLPIDLCSEQRSEPVPPEAHGSMTQVDPTLEQQILDIPQR